MEWGVTPWKFDGLMGGEKAEMMAYCWAKNKYDAFRHEESERLAPLKAAKAQESMKNKGSRR